MDNIDEEELEAIAEVREKAKSCTKMFKDTFNTPAGLKLLDLLKSQFVDIDIYRHGQTYEHTAFRQGQASIIKKIINEVNRHG